MEKTDLLVIPANIYCYSPFIRVAFEGKEMTFLVDSGGYGCVVDRKHVSLPDEELGREEILTGMGAGSTKGHQVVSVFSIEDETFVCPFTVTDLGNTFCALEKTVEDIAGIIGGEFLFTYNAVIDYGRQEMRIERKRIHEVVEEAFRAAEEEKYPLSETEFKRLQNLKPQEYNKLPVELQNKFQEMLYIKKQEMGLLDWE